MGVGDIRRLYTRARQKRAGAFEELQRVVDELRVQANRQYRSLQRSTYAWGNAFDYARGFIANRYGSNAKSFYKETDIEGLYRQGLTLNRLLSDETFSIRGLRKLEERRFASFKQNGIDIVKELGGKKKARQFLRFLGNTGASDYLDFYSSANSGQVLEQIFEIYSENDEYRERITEVFQDFQVYLETAEQEKWEGMSFIEVRDFIEKTYESIRKRRR